MNVCRFCGKYAQEDDHQLDLIQYGVRHHAHPDCLLKAKGAATFDLLQPWQVKKFPALAAERAGLYELLKEKVKSAELAVRHGY